MIYSKQPLDYLDQLQMLKSRGLIIADEANAVKQLGLISYFRLASYWRPMEADKQSHTFKPGSTFENAVQLYYFDKELRALVFKMIQGMEIALRSAVIHRLSLKYGSFWFTDASLCVNETMFKDNLRHIDKELSRSKEDFIQEHFAKYTSPQYPPVWKTLEVVSFGTLSKLLVNFSDRAVKKVVAAEFALPHRKFLESWIQCATVMRNTVAHHARIWNRKYPYKPLLPSRLPSKWVDTQTFSNERFYAQLCTLQYLQNAIHPHNTFVQDFKALLSKYPNVDSAAMGFPKDWEHEPLWRD